MNVANQFYDNRKLNHWPSFTIIITTFDRSALLSQAIDSCLNQNYPKECLEIIVINDNPNRILTYSNPDVAIRNNKTNLGEIECMNQVTRTCKSDYLCWLADDDLIHPDFISRIARIAMDRNGISAIYPLVIYGEGYPIWTPSYSPDNPTYTVMSGEEWIDFYVLGKMKSVIGVYGAISKNLFSQDLKLKKLGKGFSPYSDNLLALEISKFGPIALIEEPLVFHRIHSSSLSSSSSDISAYLSAQKDFIREISSLLSIMSLDSRRKIMDRFIEDLFAVSMRKSNGTFKKIRDIIVSHFRSVIHVGSVNISMALIAFNQILIFYIRLLLQISR